MRASHGLSFDLADSATPAQAGLADGRLEPITLEIDVTEAAAIGQPANNTVTIFLPREQRLRERAIVCFAFPGGGYSRQYYTWDLAGDGIAQSDFHSERGWIFVACDQLGFGDATTPDGHLLTYENIAAANAATVTAVLKRLASGDVAPGYPPIVDPVRIGIGHSMGGCFLIVAQAHHAPFDAIASLGFSAIHTHVPSRPGAPASVWPWVLRGSDRESFRALNQSALDDSTGPILSGQDSARSAAAVADEHPFTWAFHWDDEPGGAREVDILATATQPGEPLPPWRSATVPSCAIYMLAPGTVATEAAAIRVPVLVAMGERDLIVNPPLEATAYRSTRDVSLYVCPRMAHMHNFAHTRRQFWDRIHSWAEGVRSAILTG